MTDRELTREDVESGNYQGAGKYTCAERDTKCIWPRCGYECSGRVEGRQDTDFYVEKIEYENDKLRAEIDRLQQENESLKRTCDHWQTEYVKLAKSK